MKKWTKEYYLYLGECWDAWPYNTPITESSNYFDPYTSQGIMMYYPFGSNLITAEQGHWPADIWPQQFYNFGRMFPKIFSYDSDTQTLTMSDYVEELLNQIGLTYAGDIFVISNEETNGVIRWQDIFEFKRNLIFKEINNTYDRYSTLLDLYESNKANLLDAIKSKYTDTGQQGTKSTGNSTNAFNDTPQSENSDNFSDMAYLTNISKAKSETSGTANTKLVHEAEDERNSLIIRLREIEDNMSDLWNEWLAHFSKFFTNSNNVEYYKL